MLEPIPPRQVPQRQSEGWQIFSYKPGDYVVWMRAPDEWQPPLLDNTKPYRTCSMPGCDGKHKARGYCLKHYERLKAHGNPRVVLPKRQPAGQCTVDGCQNKHRGHGLCNMHLQRARKAKKRTLECREAA